MTEQDNQPVNPEDLPSMDGNDAHVSGGMDEVLFILWQVMAWTLIIFVALIASAL